MNAVTLYDTTRGLGVDDFDTLLPNLVLLTAIMPPSQSQGGIAFAGETTDILATQAQAFTVRRLPDSITHDGVTVAFIKDLKVGDQVILRNAMLDTMSSRRVGIVDIDIRHIKARLKREAPVTPDAALVLVWLTVHAEGPKIDPERATAMIREHAEAALDAANHGMELEAAHEEVIELMGRALYVTADPEGYNAWTAKN